MAGGKVAKKHASHKNKKPINEKKGLLTKRLLHGAIKGLLNDVKRDKSPSPTAVTPSLLPKYKKPSHSYTDNKQQKKRSKSRVDPSLEYTERNGIIYIKSKENKMIRKLSDDEVMSRHKRADQTMKDVWTKIIDKYETVQDQGDILDLQTGEIVEDHGHLRGENPLLPSVYETVTNYRTTLNDILLQDESQPGDDRDDKRAQNRKISNNETSIWTEKGDDDDTTTNNRHSNGNVEDV